VSVAHEKTREAASWQDDFEEFVLRGVHWCVLSVLVFSGSWGSSMAVAANWDAGGGGCNQLNHHSRSDAVVKEKNGAS
jgi:hypothetical protein